MFINNSDILITLFYIFLHVTSGNGQCGKCMSNEVYCVDESSYYFCMNGKPLKSMLYTCDEDHVCANDNRICVPKSQTSIMPACSSSCNKCLPGNIYTCVSKTQYGRCVNNEVVMIGTCEDDSICNHELFRNTNSICIPTCVAEFFGESSTCKNDVATITTEAPTKPDLNNLIVQCRGAGKTNKNKSFYIRNVKDKECKTYIYCEKTEANDYDALLMRCKTGYFNGGNKCVDRKPATCNK